MAESALMDAETTSFAPPIAPASQPPAKGKAGRPAGYKPFDNEVTPEDFFAMLNAINDADWPKSLVYVWRRDPFTDNTNGGREPKYVDVINRAVSERNVKEEQGSGTYKLQLNTNEKYIAHTILTIEDLNYPPHIPPGDWFNHPRNKKWLSWKPIVEKWWKDKLVSVTGAPQQASSDNAAVGELTRLVSQLANNNGKSSDGDKLSAVLVQWALQQTADERKHERDADSPGKLAELIRAVKELSPATVTAPPPPDNTILLTFVMTQLTETQKQNSELLKLILTQKSDQANPLSQVETMVKLFETVSGIAKPAAPREPWLEVVEGLGPQVVGALDKWATGMAMSRNMQQQRPQQPQQPIQIRPAQQPSPVIPAPAPPVAASEPAAEPAAPEMDTNQLTMLMNIAGEISMALNLCLTGEQYADQFCFKHGEALYESVISQPKEQVVTVLKAIPQAWRMLQPFEQVLPAFIDSFYAYADEEPQELAKSISQPESVPLKKPKAKKSK